MTTRDKILVADDDRELLETISDFYSFKFPTHTVETFEDSISIRARINSSPENIVLASVDNSMESKNVGTRLVEDLAGSHKGQFPFIMYSSTDPQDMRYLVDTSGLYGFASKPNILELIDISSRALDDYAEAA